MILACRQLHKAYGIDVILEKITFHIEEREKAAIVGVNGAGKTTLFKVLTGEISADGGEFYLKKDASLGYLAQNIQIDSDRTIYEEMLSVFEKIIQTETNLRELENEMGNLSGQALAEKMEEYATLQHYFEQNDGYSYQSRLRGVLKGLGFADNDFNRPMNQLSGGQKTRVHLAKLLLLRRRKDPGQPGPPHFRGYGYSAPGRAYQPPGPPRHRVAGRIYPFLQGDGGHHFPRPLFP